MSLTALDGTETYDASLDESEHTLTVNGEEYDLGICTEYEEWFGGDVKQLTYSTGPYTVDIRVDRRKENGTMLRIDVEQ